MSAESSSNEDRRRFGRYEVVEEIGRGMMGTVYRAWDPAIGRSVALKTFDLRLPVGEDERKEFEERFQREAKAAGTLSHPNIVSVFDVGCDGGIHYITQELVEGRSLAAVMGETRPMPVAEVVRIGRQIAGGLECAHRAGVVHRDLKPANILVRQDGQVKILDFGVARISGSVLTQDRAVLGTPAYMSPEQVNGEAVDPRSDLFSFATLLYEMLAGTRPFEGEKFSDVMAAILMRDPPSLLRSRPDMPPAADSVLNKALAKSRAERFRSAVALMEALESALVETHMEGVDPTGRTIQAPATSRETRPRWLSPGRRRWIALGGSLAILILLVLVVGRGGNGGGGEAAGGRVGEGAEPPPLGMREPPPETGELAAGDAAAEGLARQGIALYEAGDLSGSLEAFEEAYGKSPAVVALRYADAYVRLLVEKADLVAKSHPQVAAEYRERAERLRAAGRKAGGDKD